MKDIKATLCILLLRPSTVGAMTTYIRMNNSPLALIAFVAEHPWGHLQPAASTGVGYKAGSV